MRKIFYLFGQLTDANIEWMLSKGKRERVPAGTSIVREGQPIDSLFILLDGVLEVTGPGLGTDKPIRLGCGEVVGEISFVDFRPPTATVTAAADAVVLSIPLRGPPGEAGAGPRACRAVDPVRRPCSSRSGSSARQGCGSVTAGPSSPPPGPRWRESSVRKSSTTFTWPGTASTTWSSGCWAL